MTIDINNINAFLFFQYIPTPDDETAFWAPKCIKPTINGNIETASKLFETEIAKNIIPGQKNIVPLSAGLDSRLILCNLLKFVNASDIETVTFGIPATYDFCIPPLIAKKAGVKHTAINITQIQVNTEKLMRNFSKNNQWTYLLDSFYNRQIFNIFGKDVTYWSGYMGNNIAGEHLSWGHINNFEEAKILYSSHEKFYSKYNLCLPNYNPLSCLLKESKIKGLNYIDDLDFVHRQAKCIYPILAAPDDTYHQVFPFTSPYYMAYMLGLPYNVRVNEKFYLDLFNKECNSMKTIPLKRSFGLPLKYEKSLIAQIKRYSIALRSILFSSKYYTNPLLNYFDFNYEFRNRSDYKSMILENLNNLEKRNIITWINIGDIKNKFFNYNAPIYKEIATLNALEINLKNLE